MYLSGGGAIPQPSDRLFSDDYDSGFDIRLGLEIPFNALVSATLEAGYNRFRFTARNVVEGSLADQIDEEDVQVRMQGGNLSVGVGQVGIRAYAPIDFIMQPYAHGGIGLYLVSTENIAAGSNITSEDEQSAFNIQGRDGVRIGLDGRVGVNIDLAEEISLFIESAYTQMLGENIFVRSTLLDQEDPVYVNDDNPIQYISVRAGLSFSL